MTGEEVAAIFGGPPGDYRVGTRAVTIEVGLAALPGNVMKVWRGDEGMAFIQFGPDGRVAVSQYSVVPRIDVPWYEQILDLLGL
jgi:hypothetical protein